MKALILDTSTPTGIVGFATNNKLLFFEKIEGGKHLCSVLFHTIQSFLSEDLTHIAVGIGPGSYMGIRTAATAAKLLAFARCIPLIEFPSILISIPQRTKGSFLFAADAKMGEYYLTRGEIIEGHVESLTHIGTIAQKAVDKQLLKGQTLIKAGDSAPHLKWVVRYIIGANELPSPDELRLNYIR